MNVTLDNGVLLSHVSIKMSIFIPGAIRKSITSVDIYNVFLIGTILISIILRSSNWHGSFSMLIYIVKMVYVVYLVRQLVCIC